MQPDAEDMSQARRSSYVSSRDLLITVPGVDLPDSRHQIPIRIYTPQGSGPWPLLVYLQGGGWMSCNLDTHDPLCRQLAGRVPCLVVAVDYRLAPTHKFPAAVQDSYAVLMWAIENAETLNAKPQQLTVAGDSAGGNLAAAVCLMARDEAKRRIGFQLLIQPALDLAGMDAPAFDAVREFRDLYLSNAVDKEHPYASPLRAPSVKSLPATFIITGEVDNFRAEAEAYAQRLRESGVHVNIYQLANTDHLYAHIAQVTQVAEEAVDLSVAVLRSAFKRAIASDEAQSKGG